MLLFQTKTNVKQQRVVRKPLKKLMLAKKTKNNLKTKGLSFLRLGKFPFSVIRRLHVPSYCLKLLPSLYKRMHHQATRLEIYKKTSPLKIIFPAS